MARYYVWALLLTLVSLSGCRSATWTKHLQWRDDRPAPTFADVYGDLAEQLGPQHREQNEEPRLTVSADSLPLTVFCRWVADKTGVSIVVEDKLEVRTVTLDVRDVCVSDVLGMVARRAGSQVTRVGRLYFMGELRPEDKGVLVRKVARLSGLELKTAVAVLLSEHGRCETYSDGLVVVGDRVEVLQRVNELLDGVEDATASTWVLQLYVVNLSSGDVLDLGLDALPALEVAASVAGASSGGIAAGTALQTASKLKGGLDLVLRASRERSTVSIAGQPLFLMVDGDTCHTGSGQRVPVPRRTVSDQGTVTTAGFDYIDTGLQLDVDLREVGHDRARVKIKGSFSAVQSFVESAPVVSRDDFNASAVIASGGVYLVNALERSQTEQRTTSLLTLGKRDSHVAQHVQIWARAYRVVGPASSAAQARGPERAAQQVPTEMEVEILPLPQPDALAFPQKNSDGE